MENMNLQSNKLALQEREIKGKRFFEIILKNFKKSIDKIKLNLYNLYLLREKSAGVVQWQNLSLPS